MSEFYFSRSLDDGRDLCLAPLSERLIGLSEEIPADIRGYFLFERARDSQSIRLLAHAISEDAIWDMKELFGLS